MNGPARHETPEGHVLVELDVDLFGRVAVYLVEGTQWELVRLPTGWRARLRSHGKARRTYRGPGHESPRQALRYLTKWGHLSP